MHRLHSILNTQRNNRIDIQISSHGRFRRGELKGLIRLVPMLGESIFVRVDSDGGAAGSLPARMMRVAISPRLAAMSLVNGLGAGS